MSWKTVSLGEIFDIARGGSPRPIESFLTKDENGVNWIMISDTKNGGKYIEKTAKKIIQEGVSSSRMVNEGDFLLTNSMSFGRPYILKTSGCIHDGWLVLSPKTENINRDYFYYYIGSDEIKQKLSSKAAGAVVKNLNKEIVSDLVIDVPPLETQKRIANILDAADALRQKDQELLKKYDDLAQAIFIDMFGDPVKNEKGWMVSKLGDCSGVGSSVRVFVEELVEEGIPFLRGQEIGAMSTGELIEPSLHITKEHYNRLKSQGGVPKIGDLLMPSICPDGRIFQVVTEDPFYFKDGRVLWIKVNEDHFNSTFLRFLLKEKFLRNYTNIASGTTFAELKIFALKDLELIVPEMALQKKFAQLIKSTLVQLQISRKESANSSALFNSLIQKAFNGELVD